MFSVFVKKNFILEIFDLFFLFLKLRLDLKRIEKFFVEKYR